MNTTTIFAEIADHSAALETQRQARWGEFCSAVADAKISNPEQILSTLQELHKSPDELETAVAKLRQRRSWRTVFEAGEAAGEKYPALLQKRADAEDELEKLIAEHNAKHQPLEQEIARTQQAIAEGDSARRNLLDSLSDGTRQRLTGHLHAKRIRLEKQLDDATRRQRTHEATVANSRIHAPADERQIESVRGSKSLTKTLASDIQHLRDELAKIQSDITTVEQRYLQDDCV